MPVSGVLVSFAWSGAYTGAGTCTTGTSGSCPAVSTGNIAKSVTAAARISVSSAALAGYAYAAGSAAAFKDVYPPF